MAGGVFTCEVVYHGRHAVMGAQSCATLTALVDNLLCPPMPIHHAHTTHNYPKEKCERRQLVCDWQYLTLSAVRRDEGFESDTDSSGSVYDEPLCVSQDVKVIDDHVLRLDDLLNASGESYTSPRGQLPAQVPPVELPLDENCSSATSSGIESEDDSPRSSSNLQVQDHSNNNTSSDHNNSSSSDLNNSRSDINCSGENNSGDHLLISDILYCHISSSRPRVVVVVVKDSSGTQVHAHVFQCPTQDTARTLYAHYKEASSKYKLNRYKNSRRKECQQGKESFSSGKVVISSSRCRSSSSFTSQDRRGRPGTRTPVLDANVNVIQVGVERPETDPQSGGSLRCVTHIEVDSGPGSLASSASETSDLNSIGSYSSLGASGREVLIAGELDRKFRQRQPALLLRQDEQEPDGSLRRHEEKRKEEETFGQQEVFSRQEGAFGRLHDSLGRQEDNFGFHTDSLTRSNTAKVPQRRHKKPEEEAGRSRRSGRESHETLNQVPDPTLQQSCSPYLASERVSRLRDQSRGRSRPAHKKGPAPPVPPPRKHPENPSLLLVPTKSGAEHARAFYPKESHIVRGGAVPQTDIPCHPRSYLTHDTNTPTHQYPYYGGGGTWVHAHEYHAHRSREPALTPEMRRRSRSKSPARRPMAHRYIDAVSQTLRGISDAVFTSRKTTGGSPWSPEVRGHQRSRSTVSGETDNTLRPVIRKGRRPEPSPQCRRVTFSAYATVQVMQA
nr:uncharacterized protein LOC128694211 [Cherax quadricarinatus]XP_053640184.1 uncharacterized protein LOC128694211 [Cherax quadricarinatus]XP_053640185.1 uncharacterized protein LOC128694211 [Cherax quadricarinatus]XP_053640186.1 uncharacterized protein LOC128694211 [Cherax quadricarinatus]XP_053640188.1 uncharacterized protein LOC128694211 [Cherax quadricarinatus]XP_053640189.1 uncharacterized protein LOC128694211 [Cherax quadricarinatus]XP_053640190.1 uncharacterized protein LOC128694211 [